MTPEEKQHRKFRILHRADIGKQSLGCGTAFLAIYEDARELQRKLRELYA